MPDLPVFLSNVLRGLPAFPSQCALYVLWTCPTRYRTLLWRDGSYVLSVKKRFVTSGGWEDIQEDMLHASNININAQEVIAAGSVPSARNRVLFFTTSATQEIERLQSPCKTRHIRTGPTPSPKLISFRCQKRSQQTSPLHLLVFLFVCLLFLCFLGSACCFVLFCLWGLECSLDYVQVRNCPLLWPVYLDGHP